MAYASQVTRGYGSDGTPTLTLMRGYVSLSGPTYSFVTRGFGSDGTTNNLLTRGLTASTLLPYPPPSGKQYVTVANLPWPAGADSVLQDASPPVVNGDVIICDTVSIPDHDTINMFSDGTFQILTGTNPARQSFVCDVFRLSGQTFDGLYTVWVNNRAPELIDVVDVIPIEAGVAIDVFDLSVFILNVEADALAYQLVSGLYAPGLTLSGGILTGIPTEVGLFDSVTRVTDITGEYTDIALTFSSGSNDDELQALLDPLDNKTGPQIFRKFYAGTVISYFVTGGYTYHGRDRWVDTLVNDSNVVKAAKIYLALQIPAQPDWPLLTP